MPFRNVRICKPAVLAAAAFVSAAPVAAQTAEPALLTLGVGYFDVNKQDDTAVEGRIEYRSDWYFWRFFRPFAGVTVTTERAVMGYAGIMADFFLTPNLVFTPSFAPALYEDGDGKDLGNTLEFRTELELAYRFANASRLGISINHISNAGIGDKNPGSESIALTYSIPLGR